MRPQHNAPAPGSSHPHLPDHLRRSKVHIQVRPCRYCPCGVVGGQVWVRSHGYHPMPPFDRPPPSGDLPTWAVIGIFLASVITSATTAGTLFFGIRWLVERMFR